MEHHEVDRELKTREKALGGGSREDGLSEAEEQGPAVFDRKTTKSVNGDSRGLGEACGKRANVRRKCANHHLARGIVGERENKTCSLWVSQYRRKNGKLEGFASGRKRCRR